MTLCRKCGERPVPPSVLKQQSYRCSRCRHATPAARARIRRYFASAKRKAVIKRDNAKRIFAGETYHSRATTPEHARAINAYLRERIRQHAAQS